jgi:hypothetical protein
MLRDIELELDLPRYAGEGYASLLYELRFVNDHLFDVDYKNDSFVYDVKQEGWLLGLVWVFGTR